MGMYDSVVCKQPLPDLLHPEQYLFQTKSLDRDMTIYTIDENGRLIKRDAKWELVPEEERPYYGTPEWDKSEIHKMIGMFGLVSAKGVDMNYHGEIDFYTVINENDWFEYKAKFTDGNLQSIERIHEWEDWLKLISKEN